MSPSTTHPRPDQVAELTRGLDLPFAALKAPHLRYIVRVVVETWNDLSARCAPTMSSGSEPEVSALLQASLGRRIDHDRRWRQMVSVVTRGSESISYDGQHLQKEPDLLLHLTCRSGAFPFIIECKIIHPASGKRVGLYVSEGVDRFVAGEYAWATREAMMLAFVRNGSSTHAVLAPALAVPLEAAEDILSAGRPGGPRLAIDLAYSSHDRGFKYIRAPAGHREPGPIRLLHLWVQ